MPDVRSRRAQAVAADPWVHDVARKGAHQAWEVLWAELVDAMRDDWLKRNAGDEYAASVGLQARGLPPSPRPTRASYHNFRPFSSWESTWGEQGFRPASTRHLPMDRSSPRLLTLAPTPCRAEQLPGAQEAAARPQHLAAAAALVARPAEGAAGARRVRALPGRQVDLLHPAAAARPRAHPAARRAVRRPPTRHRLAMTSHALGLPRRGAVTTLHHPPPPRRHGHELAHRRTGSVSPRSRGRCCSCSSRTGTSTSSSTGSSSSK